MANTINTRIVLRNDTLENWNKSAKVLLKGEAALARLDGELSDSFQLRIGTGEKTWSQLEPSNIIIPSQNISALTYDEYKLSSLETSAGEQSKFQLVGKNSKTQVWTAIGTAIAIPEVDFTEVNAKINYLSGVISNDISNAIDNILTSTIPEAKSELSNTLSTYTDEKISGLKGVESTAVSTDVTLEGLKKRIDQVATDAGSDASTKADNALTASKEYTNTVSSAISSQVSAHYDELKELIAGGIHFVGKVTGISSDTTATPNIGYYTQAEPVPSELTDWVVANNGDLVILSSVEYVWASSTQSWEKFGDEGDWASKGYVDEAKAAAIAATKNTVQQVSAFSELTSGTNTGDIGIVKAEIGSTGTYEYTAYVWSAELTAWKQMDGNYSADSVIMPTNIRITKTFGKYDIPAAGYRDLECAGMTMKSFINDAFAETVSASKVNPTASFSGPADIASTNKEAGEYATSLPGLTFKYTADGYYSTFNDGLKAGNVCKLSSVYIERQALVEEDLGDPDHNTFNLTAVNEIISSDADTDVAVNGTVTLASEGSSEISVQYTDADISLAKYKSSAAWLKGTATPKNNIGADDPDNKIAAGSWSYNSGNWYTVKIKAGNRKRFWYVGTDSTTTADSAFMRDTSSGHGSDFSSTSKTISLTIPAGTKRAIYAVLNNTATLKSVIDVDGMGLDIKDKFTTTHDVSIYGANGFTAKSYTLFTFVNENGATATTFNITLN